MHKVKSLQVFEDWYPTPQGGVRAVLIDIGGVWRICIWGGDDFGMEKDSTDRRAQQELFKLLYDGITKKALSALGFHRA